MLLIISVCLLAAQHGVASSQIGAWDIAGLVLWIIGFFFESVGDWQLARFKRNPENRGKVMDRGLWRYTRHPNYFGEVTMWWGYYLVAVAAGGWWSFFSPLVMTILILRVSGVTLLEKKQVQTKPGYAEYVARTSAFVPWFPKKPPADVKPEQEFPSQDAPS